MIAKKQQRRSKPRLYRVWCQPINCKIIKLLQYYFYIQHEYIIDGFIAKIVEK
jgi:hypothetical protein